MKAISIILFAIAGVTASSAPVDAAGSRESVTAPSRPAGVHRPAAIVICTEAGFSVLTYHGASFVTDSVLAEMEKCHKANVQPYRSAR